MPGICLSRGRLPIRRDRGVGQCSPICLIDVESGRSRFDFWLCINPRRSFVANGER